ncbi:hypothetical protein PS710_04464 [Pseudomonas fluorescens]|uniref:AlpA family phage regulatory protein n=1 Tax=Pseudomonas fluorescens TaxID=294 RepID=A0A5E7EBZ7_PSEFL|nr:hypothetical protein PS710_04464 [Pseudomonas fluorescens]
MNARDQNATVERVLINIKDVLTMLGVGRTTLHRIRDRDSTFPVPIKDSLHRQAHAYFLKSEIDIWIKSKADRRPLP